MKKETEYRELPNLTDHMCFACSPKNEVGLKMKFSTDGKSLVSWLIIPGHLCGWENVAHGGVITTILDEIMGRACLYLLKKFPMTKTMSVDFLRPAMIGEKLMAEGQVVEMRTRNEVLMDSALFNKKGKTCARARATYTLCDTDAMERMGISYKDILESRKGLVRD